MFRAADHRRQSQRGAHPRPDAVHRPRRALRLVAARNGLLKPGNAPASSWTPAAATAAHRPRRRLRPRHRANKINSAKAKRPSETKAAFFCDGCAGVPPKAILLDANMIKPT